MLKDVKKEIIFEEISILNSCWKIQSAFKINLKICHSSKKQVKISKIKINSHELGKILFYVIMNLCLLVIASL